MWSQGQDSVGLRNTYHRMIVVWSRTSSWASADHQYSAYILVPIIRYELKFYILLNNIFPSGYEMNFCLYLICMASAGGVSAWYNTSSLDSCSSNNVWDQIDDFVETTIEELRKVVFIQIYSFHGYHFFTDKIRSYWTLSSLFRRRILHNTEPKCQYSGKRFYIFSV